MLNIPGSMYFFLFRWPTYKTQKRLKSTFLSSLASPSDLFNHFFGQRKAKEWKSQIVKYSKVGSGGKGLRFFRQPEEVCGWRKRKERRKKGKTSWRMYPRKKVKVDFIPLSLSMGSKVNSLNLASSKKREKNAKESLKKKRGGKTWKTQKVTAI